jgi:hypothetical protein
MNARASRRLDTVINRAVVRADPDRIELVSEGRSFKFLAVASEDALTMAGLFAGATLLLGSSGR